MEWIIENIRILIPIALFIAFRIVRAKNAESKKQQKKPAGGMGELVKTIREAQNNPDYRKALAEDTEIFIPPKVQQKTAQRPKSVPVRQAETKKVNKTVPKHSEYKSIFPEESEFKADSLPSEIKVDTAAAQVTSVAASSTSKADISLQGLPPLQQAVVWAEILGQPKAFS